VDRTLCVIRGKFQTSVRHFDPKSLGRLYEHKEGNPQSAPGKYENSTHFRNEAKVNRKILITMKPPLYVIEDTTQTKAVHMVLEELTEKKLVKVQWLQDHVNHIARQYC